MEQFYQNEIKALSYTMSKDESRFFLKSIHVVAEKGMLKLESTDGHRLVQTIRPLKSELNKKVDFIMDSRTVNMILKLFKETDNLFFDFEKIKVVVDDVSYPIITIDAVYPDFEKV